MAGGLAPTVHERLLAALTAAGVEFTTLQHRPVFTSAEAAEVRGVSLHSGAKALILKGDDRFMMAVLPADMALDSRAVRDHFGWKALRFATKEELLELTGLAPGSVPPFGSLFGLQTVCDERLGENASINFNAGSHSDSIRMTYEAFRGYEKPVAAVIAKMA